MSESEHPLQKPNYLNFSESLESLAPGLSPSELHGILCGYLCAGAQSQAEAYLNALLPHKKHEGSRKVATALFSLYSISQQELAEFDFHFELFMPADDVPIFERALAFSQWCDGFVQTFTTLGFRFDEIEEEDTQEALEHLSEFAALDCSQLRIDEEDERALAEVTEYARMAVLQIYADLKLQKKYRIKAKIDTESGGHMITAEEYQKRRQDLAKNLQGGSLLLIPSASPILRNGDAHYPFRQDSSFYYLTGSKEQDAVLVLPASQSGFSILFNRKRDPQEERWLGPRLGQEGALKLLKMQEAYPIEDFESELCNLLSGCTAVYYPFKEQSLLSQQLLRAIAQLKKQGRRGKTAPMTLIDSDHLLSDMRVFKSPAEIACLKKAIKISVAAHEKMMRAVKHAAFEYELEAVFMQELLHQGCRDLAYQPIIAASKNACILHYTENNAPLDKKALLLVDAGAEYSNYAADITRTYPCSGRFSEEQKSIYELVLKAQRAAIAAIKPGLPWDKIQKIIVEILTEGLINLKILRGKLNTLIAQEAYKPFYMHGSGHFLGLDVHDTGAYALAGKSRSLEAGMVLTVEPGLYFSPDIKNLDPKWHGIGVRIEDDILVTAQGHENLSEALPVEMDALEALISAG